MTGTAARSRHGRRLKEVHAVESGQTVFALFRSSWIPLFAAASSVGEEALKHVRATESPLRELGSAAGIPRWRHGALWSRAFFWGQTRILANGESGRFCAGYADEGPGLNGWWMLFGGLDKLEAYPTLELRSGRGGAKQGKDADECQAEDEAGDVGDRVAGGAAAAGNECL